jgi:hypothetical protein
MEEANDIGYNILPPERMRDGGEKTSIGQNTGK